MEIHMDSNCEANPLSSFSKSQLTHFVQSHLLNPKVKIYPQILSMYF